MKVSHLRAVEKQAEWLHWLTLPHLFPLELAEGDYLKVMSSSGDILAQGETLYMNATFCDLVALMIARSAAAVAPSTAAVVLNENVSA